MLLLLYLGAIVIANLTTAAWGPGVSVFNALVLIGLDLTTRDALHERWRGRALWPRMLALIGAGSLLSYLLNPSAVAVASFAAFLSAGLVDTLSYQALGNRARLVRVNGSNVLSAAVDSLVFPVLAFGWPPLLVIVAGQFLAKVLGGAVWSFLLIEVKHGQKVKEASA